MWAHVYRVHNVFSVTIQTGLITSVCAVVDLVVYLSLVRISSLEDMQVSTYTQRLFLRQITCMLSFSLQTPLTHLRLKAPHFQYDSLEALFWSLFIIP
jgi:hypothetical protein